MRVEWTRMSGDEVEDVVAIMLLREHRRGHHVRPSQGDGGIDVLIPSASPGGLPTVYQIKKFATNLAGNEKRQIEKSVRRLQAWSEKSGQRLERLYVTLPLDPTPENLTWLQGIAADVDFPVEWYGLSNIEGLVAHHENVIDYYVRGGAAKLESAAAELTGLLRSTMRITVADEANPLTPAEVRDHLGAVRNTINAVDPFYTYDFSVTGSAPDFPTTPDPDIISIVSEQMPDGQFVTITIRAEFPDAPSWKEPTGRIKARPVTDADRAAFEDFFEYGLPATFPAELTLDLPGGLGTAAIHGTVNVGPIADEARRILRWHTVDAAGETCERVVMDTGEATRGVRSDSGVAVTGTDLSGVFSSTWRIDVREQVLRISIETHDLEGRNVSDIQEATSFLRSFGHPHRLRISPQFGPISDTLQDIPETALPSWVAIAQIVDDLVTLQSVTNHPIRLPSLDDLDTSKQSEIRRLARLVRGEIIQGTWGADQLTVTLHDGLEPPDPTHVLGIRYVKNMVLDLGQQQIEIGATTVELPFARRAAVRLDEGGKRSVVLAPIPENNIARMQLGAPTDVAIGQVFMCQVGSLVGAGPDSA